MRARFPDSDRKLVASGKKVAAAFRKYAAKLAVAGFGKPEQEQLVESMTALEKLAATLRKDKTNRSGAAQARTDAIAKLRRCIKFLREAGRRAFRDSPEVRDFAPLTRLRKVKAKAGPAPKPATTSARQGSSARRPRLAAEPDLPPASEPAEKGTALNQAISHA